MIYKRMVSLVAGLFYCILRIENVQKYEESSPIV
jgi:hypothetical protein